MSCHGCKRRGGERYCPGRLPATAAVTDGRRVSAREDVIMRAEQTLPPPHLQTFLQRLEQSVAASRLAAALTMLKAERFHLFSQVADGALVGVVRSQSSATRVYSCRLAADGSFCCCTQNLRICGGLRGTLCKHLLVLIVGLTRGGGADPELVERWVRASRRHSPLFDKEVMAATFLRYQGAQAGEVDWRPTETIPEDFYAL